MAALAFLSYETDIGHELELLAMNGELGARSYDARISE